MVKVSRYPHYIGFAVDKATYKELFKRYKRWLKTEHKIDLDKANDVTILRKRNSKTNFSTFMRILVKKAVEWGVM